MAHRAVWRCLQGCIAGNGCTAKAWNEETPINCLYGVMAPCWVRYQAKKGQQRLNVNGGGDDE